MRKIHIIAMIALCVMVSTVVLEPTVTYAAPLTAEQKQARKDQKNLDSLKQGIEKIEQQLGENNAKHAKNAVKKAERNYSKLSSDAQGTEEVIALKTRLDTLTHKVTQELAGAKEAKKDIKNIASVEKYLERIQPYLAEENIPSARRSIDDAIRIFAKISENGLQQENVVALKSRLDELTKEVESSEVAAEEYRELLNAMIM